MEKRLIRPDLKSYTKMQYIKKYWYFVLIGLFTIPLSFFIVSRFTIEAKPFWNVMIMFMGMSPFLFIGIHYEILYIEYDKQKWAEYARWENEPEIKQQLKEDYHNMQMWASVYQILREIRILETLIETDLVFIKDKVEGAYIIYKVSDEDIKNDILIKADQPRTVFERKLSKIKI